MNKDVYRLYGDTPEAVLKQIREYVDSGAELEPPLKKRGRVLNLYPIRWSVPENEIYIKCAGPFLLRIEERRNKGKREYYWEGLRKPMDFKATKKATAIASIARFNRNLWIYHKNGRDINKLIW